MWDTTIRRSDGSHRKFDAVCPLDRHDRPIALSSAREIFLLARILGAFPVLGAAAIAAFLLVSGVKMHDFWNVDDPQQQQTEITQFLKNIVQMGGALAFLAVGTVSWPYALNIGLF